MQMIESISEWKKIRSTLQNQSIGFVPTMGNLHAGHASLLQRSIHENSTTILSIFVNPTQFNDANDLNRYPKTLEADLDMARNLGVDYVFFPNTDMMYPDEYRYRVTENTFSAQLEGQHRPGHFDGVLTVVLKLFNLIKPHKAYFGEKDRQQLLLIQDMVKALFLDIEIIACPTIRDASGLALSSRNQFLSIENKRLAARFPEILQSNSASDEIVGQLSNLGFVVDYVQDYGQYRFGAVKIQSIRLIDNFDIPTTDDSVVRRRVYEQ
ncbi:MAG: pantoate--beta-alanine ligase [Candidatus Berkiella sp.]